MANCSVDMSHPMYGYNAQDKNGIVTVSIVEEINPCVRWKSSKYTAITKGTLSAYVRKDIPEDQLNCIEAKCLNTGTLYIMSVDKAVGVTYQVRSDADAYALGFNMVYLNLPKAGTYQLKATVSDFKDTAQANAYVYTYTFNANAPGEYLRTIDFADTTVMTQTGTGWDTTKNGVTINYEVTYINDPAEPFVEKIGISTPMIVNDRSELRKFANVLLSCLTSFTHNVSTPTTDARCFGRQYNPDQIEITKEITATTTSCNDYWLNPLQSMSNVAVSGVPVTDEFTVEAKTVDGKEYGAIQISDLYYKDCNTITISADGCDCSYLSNIPVSPGIELEDDEFVALTSEHEGVDRGTVLLNPMYIGEKLLVTYNGERDVELIVANDKRLRNTHFKVTQEVVNTRGLKEYYVFNNVMITENSREFGVEGEVTLSLTFTVSRDSQGNFYEIRRDLGDR